ncbi:Lrp/AsnC family transcriptional regulator [Streptomyces huiliensis]|uniref:Lrp/AsnC family transcriptional regulator n=1 Tax=Streptomyces huiliensis TaxID=2876027 RepID=UPI0027E148B7|nr:Lrp/AsnC ligand binding domain-containing protein [Streptomyces huiliensis]
MCPEISETAGHHRGRTAAGNRGRGQPTAVPVRTRSGLGRRFRQAPRQRFTRRAEPSTSPVPSDDAGLFQAFEPAQAGVLDPEALGRGLEGLIDVEIYSQDRKSFEEFESAVAAFDEVIECRCMYGRPDYFLRVAVGDHAAYEAFLTGKLSGLTGVRCKKIKVDS